MGAVSAAAEATADVKAEEGPAITVTVATISGTCATVELAASATVQDLKLAVAKELGIAVEQQRLVTADSRILLDAGSSLKSAGVDDGASLDVVRVGWLPPVLPPKFKMKLVSARERKKERYSSGFNIEFVLEVDTVANKVQIQYWRKNDHDIDTFDFTTGTLDRSVCHWMSGTTVKKLTVPKRNVKDDLAALFETPVPILDEATTFWKPAGSMEETNPQQVQAEDMIGRRHPSQNDADPRPIYREGWFETLEDGGTEYEVELPYFGRARFYTDATGMPRFFAVVSKQGQPLENREPPFCMEKVEEYDIVLCD